MKSITSNFENVSKRPKSFDDFSKKSIPQYQFCCSLVSVTDDPVASVGIRAQNSLAAFQTESLSAFWNCYLSTQLLRPAQ